MLNNQRNFQGWGPYMKCGCCNPAAKSRRGGGWIGAWRQNETQRARRSEEHAWKKEVW